MSSPTILTYPRQTPMILSGKIGIDEVFNWRVKSVLLSHQNTQYFTTAHQTDREKWPRKYFSVKSSDRDLDC